MMSWSPVAVLARGHNRTRLWSQLFARQPSAVLLLLASLAAISSLGACGGGGLGTPAPQNSVSAGPSPITAPAGTAVVDENKKTGDTSWVITAPAKDHHIEGFASATSVERGGSINLLVNTIYPTYTIDIYRMGWYGGTGARRMMPTISRAGIVQKLPTPDPQTGLAEANWTDPYVLQIPGDSDPTNWCSGVYLAKLTAGAEQSYILFVVRDDSRHSNYLFQIADTTYQAYNNWLGKSLYANQNPDGIAARKVSYNRPYNRFGTGGFLVWEYPMIRFLEREGYDVSYASSVDTHARASVLLNHEAFLSVGHDEYWSWQMRDAVEGARDRGVNLGFLSADVSYWQIRFEPSTLDGTADRVIVGYKEAAAQQDPYALDGDPSNDKYITALFTAEGRPEEQMVGVRYAGATAVPNDLVVKDAGNFLFAGMGLQQGDTIPGIVSGEVDQRTPMSPANLVLIARSPVQPAPLYADSTVYSASSGAVVFAAGNFTTSWGVDDYYFPLLGPRPLVASDRAAQFVRNLLLRLRQHY